MILEAHDSNLPWPIRRVLVTGSRDWSDRAAVERTLGAVKARILGFRPVTLVHGAGHGADGIADAWARRHHWLVETHTADWRMGRRAGPVRNLAMIRAGADLCLAFIKDNSRGASGCAAAAHDAGIPTWRSDVGWIEVAVSADEATRPVDTSVNYVWRNGRLVAGGYQ